MDDLFTNLKQLVSERFLLAYFLPILVFVIGNLFLLKEVCPEIHPFEIFFEGEKWRWLPSFIFALGVITFSYAVSPFSGFVREFMEGKRMPSALAAKLREGQKTRYREHCRDVDASRRQIDGFDEAFSRLMQVLRDMRIQGRNNAQKPPDDIVNDIRYCLAAVEYMDLPVEDLSRMLADIENTAYLLAGALHEYDGKISSVPGEQSLHRLHARFKNQLEFLLDRAGAENRKCVARRDISFAGDRLAPTRLGNYQEALRYYCLKRYALDFDLFWKRLLEIKVDAAGFQTRVERSEGHLEFLINAMVLSGLFLAWAPAIFFISDDVILFAIMAFAPVAAMYLYYNSIVQTYRTLASDRRAAVDVYRFDVLESLKLGKPSSLSAEQAIWRRLHRHAAFGEESDIRYHHP